VSNQEFVENPSPTVVRNKRGKINVNSDKMEAHMATLTIINVIHHKTPQSGTWLHCFTATVGGASATHNVKDQEHSGDDAQVDMNLAVTPVNAGDTCRFHIGLDDDQSDVCSPQAEDQTDGQFVITSSGSQTYNAGDDWSYTVNWRADLPAVMKATHRKGKKLHSQ